jgi:hypothetical protein
MFDSIITVDGHIHTLTRIDGVWQYVPRRESVQPMQRPCRLCKRPVELNSYPAEYLNLRGGRVVHLACGRTWGRPA